MEMLFGPYAVKLLELAHHYPSMAHAPAGSRWQVFLFSPRARTKAQFNGVGRLRTYISFTHSVF
jgi:hypothetical protein